MNKSCDLFVCKPGKVGITNWQSAWWKFSMNSQTG